MKKTLIAVLCVCVFVAAPFGAAVYADDILEDEPFVGVITSNGENTGKAPVIDASAAIVLDTVTGRVLFEKNAYTERPMASTTKIMTAILAIENGKLGDTVTVSLRAAAVGGSTIHLRQGEKLTLNDMLYGLMLMSGNDAAVAIAEHIGGSVDNFLKMMNEKAKKLGALNTCFKSPHGLDLPGHYTTAYDLALITRYALENPVFSRIVGTKSTRISARGLSNTNEMLDLYPGADGVKTGYTGLAGRCLVTSATRKNWRLISVVLGCGTRQQRAQSSKAILDYSFSNYEFYNIIESGEALGKVPVIRGIKADVEARSVENVRIPLRKDQFASLKKKVRLPGAVSAPVSAGEDLGTLEIMLEGEVIAHSALKAWADVRKKVFWDYLLDVVTAWHNAARTGILY